MNLNDLREVQNRERSTDSLQELPDSFYEDVGEYIRQLKAERGRAAERADDPFDDPDIDRLTDEIRTAEQVAEAIYERRVGKIVRQASFAAADMSGDIDGLTAEERRLYDDITDRITENKSRVLDILDGEDPGGIPDAGTDPVPDRDRDTEAGGATGSVDTAGGREDPDPEQPVDAAELMGGDADDDPDRVGDTPREEASGEPTADGGAVARSTVRVTSGVGEVFGVDERVYRLEAEDVVCLPEENAAALVEKDAAKRL